ncbi:serine/threonine-protein kinase [Hyalangium sp.]|uniref:serine/threonine protein kinase n=1 Tax=Hyalangium sp. TaxID=2028555 RepID=UPI002D6BC81D|nr:serine/threonine-protein kinase [Hyalangium sp.]HYI01770.1 serine/threonine-protein kinase [Hyalangium sp.]
MEREHVSKLHPACLPAGTVIGSWCVVSLRGQGTYGVVYRAVKVGKEEAGPVALKLAVHAQDPRFVREGELLSRIDHPSVPRLLGHGYWVHPSGAIHPYLVMEWVEGLLLYDWAREHHLSSRQGMQLLAQIARALVATHAVGGVHRDVKGDNVLVRRVDVRAILMDFGAGYYEGARILTPHPPPPGTPAYRAPEAWQFVLRSRHEYGEHYKAGPADDLFALGVTAYRLVTGEYPPLEDPWKDEAGAWYVKGANAQPPNTLNPRVDLQLNDLILRMLSAQPEVRGSAVELAEALEQAAERAGAVADQPLFSGEQQAPSVSMEREAALVAFLSDSLRAELLGNKARLRPARRPRKRRVQVSESRGPHFHKRPARIEARGHTLPRKPLLAAASVVVGLLLWSQLGVHSSPRDMTEEAPVMVQDESDEAEEERDGGSAGVGDAVLTAPRGVVNAPSGWKVIVEQVPPKPFPGQYKPDVNGQCPRTGQVVINGGCWVPLDLEGQGCEENGYIYNGKCFSPAFPPRRQPASTPVMRLGEH